MASSGDITIDNEHTEHRCEACKKEIKIRVRACRKYTKSYHQNCANKHRIYDKNKQLIPCEDPYEDLIVGKEKEAVTGMAKARHEMTPMTSKKMKSPDPDTIKCQ